MAAVLHPGRGAVVRSSNLRHGWLERVATGPTAAEIRSRGVVVRVLLVAGSLSNNNFGRAHSVWLACRELRHETRVRSVQPGEVWLPLRGSAIAQDSRVVDLEQLERDVRWAEVVVALKPMPASLGVVHGLAVRCGRPLLVDVDDPDIEARSRWIPSRRRRLATTLRHPRFQTQLLHMSLLVRALPVMVSNPVLQSRYGGVVLPHTRPDTGAGGAHKTRRPTVAFIGTNRPHKGVPLLREALAAVAGEGFRLVITDYPPADPRPWESWLGHVPEAEGMRVLRASDIVVLPSSSTSWSRAQLPMKLIDAMLAGRAVAVSDIGPLRWAVGGAGLMLPDTDMTSLVSVLRRLADPALRTDLGARARELALSRYTPAATARVLDEALTAARAAGPVQRHLLARSKRARCLR